MTSCAGSDGEAASGTTHEIRIAWEAPTSDELGSPLEDLAGFRVYDGPESGTYEMVTDVGLSTRHTLVVDRPGTYWISVTAYDASGAESEFSNEIQVSIR